MDNISALANYGVVASQLLLIMQPFAINRLPVDDGIRLTRITSATNESSLHGDQVWFAEDSPNSYSAYLDSPTSMTEIDVINFIRAKDPNLYDKLLRPLPTALPVISDLNQQANLDSASLRNTQRCTCCTAGMAFPTPGELRHPFRETAHEAPSYEDDTRSHLKQHVVTALLNDHSFVLRKAAYHYGISCDILLTHPDRPSMDRHHYLLTLEPTNSKPCSNPCTNNNVTCYCLTCLEALFGRTEPPQHVQNNPSRFPSMLDGLCDDGTIISAAERLMPTFPASPMKELSEAPGLAFDHPSNSSQSLHLRRKRQLETDNILQHLERNEKRVQIAAMKNNSPTLAITTPPDMPPPQERYKKQGRTRWNKWGTPWTKRTVDEVRSLSPEPVQSPSTSTPIVAASTPLQCYCQESDSDAELIQCSSDYCVVGWVHLRCSGLKRLPTTNEFWYCKYCSDTSKANIAGAGNGELKPQHLSCLTTMHQGDPDVNDKSDGEDDSREDSTDASIESISQGDDASTDEEEPSTPPTTPYHAICDGERLNPTPYDFLDGPPYSPLMSQINTFTSINNIRKYAPLPVDCTQITFSDLAPSIYAEEPNSRQSGLTRQHITALEQWKALCPTSKLLQPALANAAEHAGSSAVGETRPGTTELGVGSMARHGSVHAQKTFTKLSTVLADVDRQISAAAADRSVNASALNEADSCRAVYLGYTGLGAR